MWINGIGPEAVHVSVDDFGVQSLFMDSPIPSLLTEAFEDDIQTLEDAETLYEQVASVPDGSQEEVSFSGNTCTVFIGSAGVRIVSDVMEECDVIEMSRPQYLIILNEWTRLLQAREY